MSQKLWCCPRCKSHRVQGQMWVRLNTSEVLDDTDRYRWCDACEEDGADGELNSLIELAPEETREGSAPERAPIELAIVVEGGCVVDVYCKQPISYDLFDYDNLESEMPKDEATEYVTKSLEKYQ